MKSQKALRLGIGSALTAAAFGEWCARDRLELRFIQPGKPDQNAYLETFDRSYRTGMFDAHVFDTVDEVRPITEMWPRNTTSRGRTIASAKYRPGPICRLRGCLRIHCLGFILGSSDASVTTRCR